MKKITSLVCTIAMLIVLGGCSSSKPTLVTPAPIQKAAVPAPVATPIKTVVTAQVVKPVVKAITPVVKPITEQVVIKPTVKKVSTRPVIKAIVKSKAQVVVKPIAVIPTKPVIKPIVKPEPILADYFGPNITNLTNKSWIVTFNKSINPVSVNDKNIYITDEDGQKIPDIVTKLDVKQIFANYDNKELWEVGKTYYLIITKDILAEDGGVLVDPVKMKFTIQK